MIANSAQSQPALVRFSAIVSGLVSAVFSRHLAGQMTHQMMQAINRRVIGTVAQVRRLAEAWKAGTLRTRRRAAVRRRPAAAPPEGVPSQGPAAKERPYRLPGQFGWLIPLMPGTAVTYGNYITALLTDPEMAAFLAASPRIVQALKPMCRMLGARIPPQYLPERKPRKPRRPKQRKARKPAKPPAPRDAALSPALGQVLIAPAPGSVSLPHLDNPKGYLRSANWPAMPAPRPSPPRRRSSG